ncbi:carbohydrate sulfotransferase 11-like [Diadema antillarum]|uniref:carbohydrate sulfotransferase 11-like n=1 Tax=Diadema antillarum TaxID=105358 RepID=UPI003A8AF321
MRSSLRWCFSMILVSSILYAALKVTGLSELETSLTPQKPQKGPTVDDNDYRWNGLQQSDFLTSRPAHPDDFVRLRNENRVRAIDAYCNDHPELRRVNVSRTTLDQLLVSDKQKLVYCFIPKVGCTNWKSVMLVLDGANQSLSDLQLKEIHYEGKGTHLRDLTQYSRADRTRILTTYKKFMYVRHPFVRLLSAYKNKFEDVMKYPVDRDLSKVANKIIKLCRDNVTREDLSAKDKHVSWREFTFFLTSPGGPSSNEHFNFMHRLCDPCTVKYDFIGKLETVAEDAPYMLRQLGVESNVTYPSRDNFHETNSSAVFNKALRKLSNDTISKLLQVYAHDFGMFGYEARLN